MNLLIIGTGYVGLNTGVALAYLGHKVSCLDVDVEKINSLKNNKIPMYEPYLNDLLLLAKKNLFFTSSYDEANIPEQDVIFICVGTPSLSDGSANLEYVKQAAKEIGKRLNERFSVIVNKSTVPIGSGNWVEALINEAYSNIHEKKAIGSFAIASNPEFLRQGSALFDTFYPDRIVLGAQDKKTIDVLTNIYNEIINQDFKVPEFLPRPEGLKEVPVVTCDITSAELIKYAANSFLALKISYINEISHLANKVGADIKQIARGIGLDSRIGSRFLNPGIGWGGSCFGKDTAALISIAHEYKLDMPIIQAARDVNYQMRDWVIDRLLEKLKIIKGKTIGLLGLSFKPNTDDLRDAPSIDIAKKLVQRGAIVRGHDPVAIQNVKKTFPNLGIHLFENMYDMIEGCDAVVLITEWPEYKNLYGKINEIIVIDGRFYF